MTMQTTITRRNRTGKSIFAFGAFIAVLLAIICPTLSGRALGDSAKSDSPATLTFAPDIVLNYSNPASGVTATTTVGRGINSNGDIVGSYMCVKNATHPCTGITSGNHGFLLLAG